jgi:hypothetical protein
MRKTLMYCPGCGQKGEGEGFWDGFLTLARVFDPECVPQPKAPGPELSDAGWPPALPSPGAAGMAVLDLWSHLVGANAAVF